MSDPEKTAEIDAKTAQLHDLIRKRGPACPETRRRVAGLAAAGLAASAALSPSVPPPAPANHRPDTRTPLRMKAVALLLCLGLSACVPVEAVDQARTEAAALNGLAALPGVNPEVRAVAARGSLAWRAQHMALVGEDVPGAEAWPEIPAEFLPPAKPEVQ